MTNPWNLSPQRCAVVDALSRLGCAKLVARDLGISPRTVEAHMASVRDSMKVSHSILAAVAWDRHARQEVVA